MFRSRSAAKAKEEASSALAPFEVQALFIRTKGAGNTESWPDVLTLRAPSGVASKAPFATRSLKRDKPCCYISTEAFVATDETLFEVCDEDDVWLTCALSPTDKAWKLECRFTEESQKTQQPRWDLTVEVSLVGKFQDCPCFLQENAVTTRRISRGKGSSSSLKAIEEEGASDANSNMAFVMPDFSERFMETYKSLGGAGTLSEGEDITWFNAGLRIGVGVGLGICLGAGLGAGILVRSYQMTANSLKKKFSTL